MGNKKEQIVISGAGLVGSLLSLFLRKRGYDVSVFERRPDMRKDKISAGKSINLALSDRGLKALNLVGLGESLKKLAIPMEGRMMHDKNGETAFQAYGLKGQAINSISRGGLNMELMSAAEKIGVEFKFRKRCTGIDTTSARTWIKDEFSGESNELNPDVLFGADGAFSAVRKSLLRTDRFDYQQSYLQHGYKELTIPADSAGKWQLEKNCLHIWPRNSFMLIALPNLDGSFTCTLFYPFEGEHSFENINTEKELIQFFETEFPDALKLMPSLVEDFFTNPTSSLVTVKCYPWTNRKNIALIGDAAHAIVPFYGQGMNAGFEDCTILDEIIDKHQDWPSRLKAYEQSRKLNGDAIADLAVYNFLEMRDSVADPSFLLRKKIEKHLHKNYPDQYVPVYSMVTFSHVPYSQAWEMLSRQNGLFKKILNLDDIENKWQSQECITTILEMAESERAGRIN